MCLCTPSLLEQEDSVSWSLRAKYSLGVGQGTVCERGRVLLEDKGKEKSAPLSLLVALRDWHLVSLF